MKKVRVILWGLGAMGGGMARLLLQKEGIEIVGAIDHHDTRVGKTLSAVLGVSAPNLEVQAGPEATIVAGAAEIVLVCTGSFTREVLPQLELVAAAKMNCITIAEEMAYPEAQEPQLAAKLDAAFKQAGVSLLGTGINPGFVLDALIIALSGVCTHVESIKAVRINDLSPFGPTVMRTQGVGTTVEDFNAGISSGHIVGHVGFPESIGLIASALGLKIDRIEEVKEAIISNTYRETPHIKVQPGMVAGCKHIAYAYHGDKLVITLEHPQQVRPEVEQIETGDYIYITGTPNINMAIKPEIPGGIGTIAMAVNMIPAVINAAPGLCTMAELPIPRALMGDISQLVAGCRQ
ncbi:MAG: 2,4-diaminopentanoate dehydrogenase [Firmicutes bacterium]|nr:2,4-diaminopentanoate dehydrogenase [Bacillota bacterium]MBT9158377.1 2,4-diaminopentanoate dehydrogenase [Bacillota bacterium]